MFDFDVILQTGATEVIIEPLAPRSERVDEPVPPAKKSVWEAHFGLFLTIIILLGLCIIVTIICCICLRCRTRQDSEKVDIHCVSKKCTNFETV